MVLQVLQVQAFVACWGSQRVVVEGVYSVSERENINQTAYFDHSV